MMTHQPPRMLAGPDELQVGDLVDIQIGYKRVMGARIHRIDESFPPNKGITFTDERGARSRQIIAPEDAIFLLERGARDDA